jgi:hypothetical protein
MASEYLATDGHGLLLLAELEDAFHCAETSSMKLRIASEIRHQRTAFGLTPMDRRRLQWEVERTESAQAKRKPRRVDKSDPRAHLGVVVDNTKTTPRKK